MRKNSKRALYESIMSKVSKEVKNALNEISSKTYYDAADKQAQAFDDDDYILNHTNKQLVHNKRRILKFKEFADNRKEEEDFEERRNNIINSRNKEDVLTKFYQSSSVDKFIPNLGTLVTDDILRSAVIDELYSNDFYDAICGSYEIYGYFGKQSAMTDLYDSYSDNDSDTNIANSIVNKINKNSNIKYKVIDYDVIVPQNFNIPILLNNYKDEILEYILDSERDEFNLNDCIYYNEIAKDCFINENILEWNGKSFSYTANPNVEDCKFRYFIDCSDDGEIDDWCEHDGYYWEGDDIIFIKNKNASRYSDFIGILCKYKRDANKIVKEIGEYTGREWEAPDVLIMKKGLPYVLWSLKDLIKN